LGAVIGLAFGQRHRRHGNLHGPDGMDEMHGIVLADRANLDRQAYVMTRLP
jgi:hypothetical protein